MARRAWMALAASAIAWLTIPPMPASAGGGGCHAAMTNGTGDAVAIREGCFTPGIIQVDPGASVAFSNEDPYAHNVSASGWGHLDPLEQGDGFTATFAAPGVYPFACTYHPGMTGAVVVGDGADGANDASAPTTSASPAGEASVDDLGAPAAEAVVAARTEPASAPGLGWAGGAAGGLAAGIAIGVVAGRRRRGEG